MSNFIGRGVVLLIVMLGAAQVSFCATAEEAMLEADKIEVEILKQAIDFSRANILKKQANVLSAQNELEESKRWFCKFEQDKKALEAKKLFSSIKNVFKKMWHNSYPYGLKLFKYTITDPVSLAADSMQFLLAASYLMAFYGISFYSLLLLIS